MNALQAYQLAAMSAAATQNFGPPTSNQSRFADTLGKSAGQGILAENQKKIAKKMKKKNGILDTVFNVASVIPGPQQPFVMAGNAAYKATQGDMAGAGNAGVGAMQGFQDAYGTAPAAAVPQSPGPMASGYVPAAAPSGIVPDTAPAAAPATATPGPMASGYNPTPNYVVPALAAGAAALGVSALQNRPAPTGVEVARNAQQQGTAGDMTALQKIHGAKVINSLHAMKKGELNGVRGIIMSQQYLEAMRQQGQKIPTQVWYKLPAQVRRSAQANQAYAGIIPSGMDRVAYFAAPALAALGAGVATNYAMNGSSLVQGQDGVYNYVPGG